MKKITTDLAVDPASCSRTSLKPRILPVARSLSTLRQVSRGAGAAVLSRFLGLSWAGLKRPRLAPSWMGSLSG